MFDCFKLGLKEIERYFEQMNFQNKFDKFSMPFIKGKDFNPKKP